MLLAAPRRILFVCTANICRSPLAEGICRRLSASLTPTLLLHVDSAGTLGEFAGQPPDVRAQRVALEHGYDLSGLRARSLVGEDFERFDLLLAMDRRNYDFTRKLAPRSLRGRVRMLVDFAPQPHPKEIEDPYCGTTDDFARTFTLTEAAVRGLLQWLAAFSNPAASGEISL